MIVDIENLFSTEEQKNFDYITLYNKDKSKILHRQKVDFSRKVNSLFYKKVEFLVNIENAEVNIPLESLNNIIYGTQEINTEVEPSKREPEYNPDE